MIQLSKNFHQSEIVSSSFSELAKSMVVETKHILAAQVLALTCLQPGRNKWGIFDVLSWVRDTNLNKAVGGSSTSDHLLGSAADVSTRNFNAESVFKWYVEESGVPFRQIIYYPEQNFFHISCNHPEKPIKNEAFVYLSTKDYIPFNEYYGNE